MHPVCVSSLPGHKKIAPEKGTNHLRGTTRIPAFFCRRSKLLTVSLTAATYLGNPVQKRSCIGELQDDSLKSAFSRWHLLSVKAGRSLLFLYHNAFSNITFYYTTTFLVFQVFL